MSLRDDRVSIGDMLQFSQEAYDLLGQSSLDELSIVDLNILWNTITDDLPPLIMVLEKVVKNR